MDIIQGVYICSGCGIGDAIDTEKLEKVASDEHSAKVCRTDAFLCGAKAVECSTRWTRRRWPSAAAAWWRGLHRRARPLRRWLRAPPRRRLRAQAIQIRLTEMSHDY